jgi:hypothetical protein
MKNYLTISLLLLVVFLISARTSGLDKTNNAETQIMIYSLVSEMPVFENNGTESFESVIKSRLKYPIIAKQNGYYGIITLNFVVDIDGTAKNAKVLTGEFPSLNYEAITAVNGIKGWKPGKFEGLPVPVRLTTTIKFLPTDSLPINKDNVIQTNSDFENRTELTQPLNEMNGFISKFRDLVNNPGWYNCNNSFKYMEKKVARFEITDNYESIFVVFKTESKIRKDAIGEFNEKEEIKELLKRPDNDMITVVGVKLIDNQLMYCIRQIEPKGDLISLDYQKTNSEDFLIRINKALVPTKA